MKSSSSRNLVSKPIGLLLLTFTLIALGVIPVTPAPVAAQGPITIPGIRVTAAAVGVVDFIELARQEATRPPATEPAQGVVVPYNVYVEPGGAPNSNAPAAPVAPSAPSVASPAPSNNYIGLDDIAKVGTSTYSIPPDTMGAVGPDKVFDTLNNNYRVQNKSTGATISTVSMNTFWASTGGTGLFDPVTLYDPYNNRFIVVGVSNASSATSSIEVGISAGSDPGGSYSLFRFQACQAGFPCGAGVTDWWADYPAVGFNKNWVAISVNMFTNAGNAFQQSRVLVVDYTQLLAGSFSAQIFTAIPDFTVRPCVTYSSTENTLYAPNHGNSTFATYRLNTITGTPGAPTYTQGALKTHTLAPMSGGWVAPSGNILPQAAGSAGAGDVSKIDSGDARILRCTFRNNNVWYSQTVGLPAGSLTHTGAQWIKLDTGGNDVDGGRVEDPTATNTNGGKWYAYPTLTVNGFNEVLMGFTQFASNQWPSAGYTFRGNADAAGTMRDPFIYKAGEGMYWKTFNCGVSIARNRWGDYSATQVDPVDDIAMWTLQEYSKPEGSPFAATGCNSGVWSTWWAKVPSQVGPLNLHLFLPLMIK